MSWRDHIKVHPAADLFPMMSDDELRELGEDIKTHGLKSHLKLYKGKLLDGRNRLEAMELAGVPVDWGHDVAALGCPFDHLNDQVDAYDYVISANLHRRHLTSEQKRELIDRVLKAKPEQSDASIAKQTKTSDKTVAKRRRKLESTSEIPKLDKTVGKDGKKRGRPPKRKVGLAPPAPPRPELPAEHHVTGSAEVSEDQHRARMAALDPDDLSIPDHLKRTEPAAELERSTETQAQIDSRRALNDFKVECKIYLPKLTAEDLKSASEFFRSYVLQMTDGIFAPEAAR